MDRKTVLAVVLSLAVIFLYQFFVLPRQPLPPPRPVAPQTPQTVAPEPQLQAASPVPAPAPAAAPAVAEVARLMALQEGATARDLTIDTGVARITLQSSGAVISSWKLLHYRDQAGQPLELVPASAPGALPPLGVQFKDDALTRSFGEGIFLIQGGDQPLDPTHPEETVTLSRTDPAGVLLTKRITFHYNSYLVTTALVAHNLGPAGLDVPWELVWGAGVGREGDGGGKFTVGPLVLNQGKLSNTKPKKDGERLNVPPGLSWIGLTDRYFLAAFVPEAPAGEASIRRLGKSTFTIGMGPQASLLPTGGESALHGTWFAGPKSIDLLKSYRLGLEHSLDFGWSGLLGRPLLDILKFFHGFARNWGVAIILLTLLVRLCLFPVTFHMYKSMRRMQEFQPQIAALKKKYKDDTQAMNREMMDLYREHKINPMGGCLPMLVQIPIFFALYRVLSIAIELRGAPFLHIRDLSAGETTLSQFLHGLLPFVPEGLLPLKILVLLMGLTMFIQQRLSPTMGDPRQAKMMMFLPVIFTAMFWNFTSGLVVYFFFSNILAIGEQLLIKKWTAGRQPAVEAPDRVR